MQNDEIKRNNNSRNNLLAELGFLKSQVTPHVLFNTLSFIKFAVIHEPRKAEEAVDRLADLLSYAIGQSAEDAVLLEHEIEQMENMVNLQMMRFDGRQNLTFSVNFDVSGIRIIPLILITLLENVFRHGNSLRKDAAITIELRLIAGYIIFSSSNPVSAMQIQEKTDNGLKLCEQRLERFYKGDYRFNYGQSGDYFVTCLEIPVIR